MKLKISDIKISKSLKLVLVILFLGFLFRLYRIDFPLADWHSWRQTDTAAVTRIYAKEGINILYPKYFDISNIQTGQDNPMGYRFVEFPLFNIVHAILYKAFPILPLIVWGRLLSVFASLAAGLFLYLLVKNKYSEKTALFTLVIYLFLPFSIFYGRTILPDTAMVGSSIAGIYFFDRYLNKEKGKLKNFLLSAVLMAAALLLKPYAVFFLFVHFFLSIEQFGKKIFFAKSLYFYLVLIVAPLISWRMWIANYPEGVPANTWLLNGNGIRFRPAFFRWILYERLTRLIAGYFGIVFIAVGLFRTLPIKKNLLAGGFILSSVLYVTVFATGNVQHDYYQIAIIPTVSLLMGIGASFLFSKGKVYRLVTIIFLFISFMASFNIVKDYYNINNIALVNAGKKADETLPKDAKVIAPYGGDTSLLYYINRKGWPAMTDSVENLKGKGATHMVIVNPTEDDINGFGKQFEIVDVSQEYLILKL